MDDLVLVERTPAERLAYFEGRLSMAEEVLRWAVHPDNLGIRVWCTVCGASALDGEELVHRGPYEGGGMVRPYAGCPAVLWVTLARAQVELARAELGPTS